MIVRSAVPSEHLAILRFYERCGYRGGLSDSDDILVALDGAELVGVVRLCYEDGITVVRGMQVHPDQQRKGVGIQLLRACTAWLGPQTCFCLPYGHLIEFYERGGFRRIDEKDLPPALLERLRRYRQSKMAVIPMVRTATSPPLG